MLRLSKDPDRVPEIVPSDEVIAPELLIEMESFISKGAGVGVVFGVPCVLMPVSTR